MEIFKKCPKCDHVWPTRDSFLSDPTLTLNGYQADFTDLEGGLLLLTHGSEPCYSTMAITAHELLDLYTGPRYQERKTLTETCPRYCLDKEQLARCDALCECAFVREIVNIVNLRLLDAKAAQEEIVTSAGELSSHGL